MDFKALLKHLNKYKWILIIVPVVTVAITYYMVKNLPKQYSSEAQISTGLVDQSKQVQTGQSMDYFKLSQQFSNIIEKMKMKKVMSILSYDLIIHDLENPKAPLRKYSVKLDSLPAEKRMLLAEQFKNMRNKREILTLSDTGNNDLYNIISSMGYDEENINKHLNINRPDGSDFVNVKFLSENPKLSAYVVNTLSVEFIDNYGRDVGFNENNSIQLLDSLLKRKEAVMNSKNTALKNFKMANGVLNLDKQSEIAYMQISQNEDRKAAALRDIQASQGAIAAIDARLRGRNNVEGGSTTLAQNREIIDLNNQIKAASSRYVDGNFKVSDRKKMDSLQDILNAKTYRNTDNNVVDPLVSKQNLIQQRSNLELTLNQAKSSIASIDKDLAVLRVKYNSMVPFDAGIQNYERDADLATKDYMDALTRYNQTRTDQNLGLKLNIAQLGLIEPPEPSKRAIYLGLSGISSFMLCFISIIALFFLDRTINTQKELAEHTSLPVIGNLNFIETRDLSIKQIWNDTGSKTHMVYKNLLRSLRLEISSQMDEAGTKILGITSLAPGEGKSFVSSSLAYAFAMTGKKVLLIGGETQPAQNVANDEVAVRENFETFLVKREIQIDDLITVLNKNSHNTSLMEIQNSNTLRAGFDVLKNEFDIILIDVDSLYDINIAKEWLMFTESNLAVFEAGRSLSDTDKELLSNLQSKPNFIGWILNKIKV